MSTSVSRIEKEFILASLLEKKAPMELRYRNRWIHCLIQDVKEKMIHLSHADQDLDPPRKNEKVDLFFKFRGARMTFRTQIRSVEKTEVRVEFPSGLFRDLSRGYERVTPTSEVKISFLMHGEKIEFDFPKSESFDIPEEPAAMANFDATRITDLLKAFRDKARDLASENKIVMFRERKPENYQERIMAATGKIVMYPQSFAAMGAEKDLILNQKILSQEELVLSETNRGAELFEVLNTIASVTGENENRGILQELYCPILFQQYVVGYLYLVTFKDGGQKISQKVVEFTSQFSRLLSYSLKVNGYFKGVPVKERVDESELIDISASGLLFCLPLSRFDAFFQLYNDMTFTLQVGEREMSILGRIMRKFNDEDRLYIGVMFLDIQEADRSFLVEYLYGSTEPPDFYPSAEEWAL